MDDAAPDADPWGSDDGPITTVAMPPHGPDLSDRPAAEDLVEVRDLMSDGWALLAWDQRMIWPVWPGHLRGWVADPLPALTTVHDRDGSVHVRPAGPTDVAYLIEDEAEFWGRLNVPPPPRSRLWFVRSPWPSHTVADLWALISRRARQLSPVDPFAATASAAAELIASDGSLLAAWDALPPPTTETRYS